MTYLLEPGANANRFAVDQESGLVRVASGASLSEVPAEELPFELVVTARDNPGGSQQNSQKTVLVVRGVAIAAAAVAVAVPVAVVIVIVVVAVAAATAAVVAAVLVLV